jgi:hypothetical protein
MTFIEFCKDAGIVLGALLALCGVVGVLNKLLKKAIVDEIRPVKHKINDMSLKVDVITSEQKLIKENHLFHIERSVESLGKSFAEIKTRCDERHRID